MSIITSNSPGTITLTSSNDNVVDITGTTADVQGLGTSTITINQAATANFNAATTTFSITVAKPDPNIIDTDGDGVVDANDFVIDDNRIWSSSQFRFDTDSWGLTFNKNKSNGQIDEFYGNPATGYVTPELDSSPIGWSQDITWKARTDLSWVSFTKTNGVVVELERGSDGVKNVNTRGDKATFNVAENNTGSNRDGYVYIDYYYKNKFIISMRDRIKQLTEKIIVALSDGTSVPNNAAPDQTLGACASIAYFSGGQTFPQKIEIEIGPATGAAELYANAYNKPDRFVLVHGNEVKIDTGYVTAGSPSTYQTQVNNALAARGLPNSTVVNDQIYGTGNEGLFHQWTKTSTDTKAYLYIYAPLGGTGWESSVSCANSNLNNIRNLLKPGSGD